MSSESEQANLIESLRAELRGTYSEIGKIDEQAERDEFLFRLKINQVIKEREDAFAGLEKEKVELEESIESHKAVLRFARNFMDTEAERSRETEAVLSKDIESLTNENALLSDALKGAFGADAPDLLTASTKTQKPKRPSSIETPKALSKSSWRS